MVEFEGSTQDYGFRRGGEIRGSGVAGQRRRQEHL